MGNTKLLAYLSKTLQNALNILSDFSVALSYTLFSLIRFFNLHVFGQKDFLCRGYLSPITIINKGKMNNKAFFLGGVPQKL